MNPQSTSRKRCSHHTHFTQCIICQAPSKERLQRLTEKGYPALAFAVQKRDDSVARRLCKAVVYNTLLSNNPLYHAKCRNAYTNRKTIQQKCRAKAKKHRQSDEDETTQEDQQRLTRSHSGHSVRLGVECFVCGKSCDKKGQRQLTLVSTNDRGKSILAKA